MKISIAFTANLVLENVELDDAVAVQLIETFEKTGTVPEEILDKILNDDRADLFVEDVIEIEEVCETVDGTDEEE
jgi:hypothetical protein